MTRNQLAGLHAIRVPNSLSHTAGHSRLCVRVPADLSPSCQRFCGLSNLSPPYASIVVSTCVHTIVPTLFFYKDCPFSIELPLHFGGKSIGHLCNFSLHFPPDQWAHASLPWACVIRPFAVHVSSLTKHLFRMFVHVVTGWFWQEQVPSVPRILARSPFYHTCILQLFSVCDLSFHFLLVFSERSFDFDDVSVTHFCL